MTRVAIATLLGVLALGAPLSAEPLITIQSSGASSNRIDMVFLGDGYASDEQDQFALDVEAFVERFFAETPFLEYRPYFNIHRVEVHSRQSGADHPSTDTYRNTALGAFFDCAGVARLVCVDHAAVNDVLTRSVTWEQRDIVIVVVNDPRYGGSGGSIAVSSVHPDGYDVVMHEVGHSFGLLADEYDYGPPACSNRSEPLEPNVTIRTDRARLKWRHWIHSSTPLPTATSTPARPGLYKGGKYCPNGIYRPTFNSKMRSLFQPFEQINVEQLTKRMYSFVSPIDDSAPAGALVTSRGVVAFSVEPVAPATQALDVRWELDGVRVSTRHGVSIDTRTLADGDHVLQAIVRDTTSFVRDDPAQLLREVRTWTIRVDTTPPSVSLVRPADEATVSDMVDVAASVSDAGAVARVEFFVDGVRRRTDTTEPFTFAWDTTTETNGAHTLRVRAVDSAGNAASSSSRDVIVANDGPTALPSGWSQAGIGAVGRAGSADESGGTFTVRGAGADIWNAADAFHYVYRPLSGNGTIVARVAALSGSQSWTKLGVMIRASTSPGSQHAFMLVSKRKGLAFQHRVTTGGASTHTAGPSGTAPRWVRLQRAGNVFTASTSSDGVSWTTVGRRTIAMPSRALVGLAATSHTTSSLATGTFDHVSITTSTTPTTSLPTAWNHGDIGAVGRAGSATESGGAFTLRGAGADIWDDADAFHYAYRSLSGDGAIVARVATLSGSQAWTKMGVMIRASTSPGSPHAFMLVSKSKGLAFQRRVTAGGVSTHTAGPSRAAPRWVRLQRAGNVFTASTSSDGVTWTVVDRETIVMPITVLVGLAAGSHTTSSLATGTFDHVSIDP